MSIVVRWLLRRIASQVVTEAMIHAVIDEVASDLERFATHTPNTLDDAVLKRIGTIVDRDQLAAFIAAALDARIKGL